MRMIQDLTVSEKGTGAEMRPAVVSGIATGNSPVSYWLILCVPYSLRRVCGLCNFLQDLFNVQGFRAWPVVYRPHPRRRKSLNLRRFHSHGSTFSPVSNCTRSFLKCRDPPCIHKYSCTRN